MLSEREIFSAALEIDDIAKRNAYLAAACGDNEQLRRHIELLLESSCVSDQFMVDSPILDHEVLSRVANESGKLPSARGEQFVNELSPGSTIGRYRIEKLLGKGGMATVYLATDLRLKRAVALKIPRQILVDEPELLQRFEREAHTMASVEHPNLCRVFDIGEQDGIPFLSMLFIEGRTLAAALEDGKKYTPREAAELVKKLAQATQVAHEAGVIHRDLKPANVMIDQQGEPIIMDFGLALASQIDSRLTRDGLIMGTPAYMAPEQAVGDPGLVGAQSDVYSLGAILYELLAGKPLYQGTTVSVLAQLVGDSQVTRRMFDSSTIDWRLQAICMKALSKDVKERYATAQELATALQNFLSGAENVPWPSRSNATRVIETKWLIGALVLLLLTVIPIYWLVQYVSTSWAEKAKLVQKEMGLSSAKWRWSRPINLGTAINTPREEVNPTLSADEKILIFNRPLNRKLQLWESRRNSIEEEFSSPLALPSHINLPGYTFDCPFLSADGLTLWFSSDRPGGFGKHDIWYVERDTLESEWQEPVHLDQQVNTPNFEQSPYVTPDGLTLYFSCEISAGRFGLAIAKRSDRKSPFEKTQFLDTLNTGDCSSFPRVNRDGTQFLFVHSPSGSGRLMIFTATRDPVTGEVGHPFLLTDQFGEVNTSAPFLADDGMTLYFSSPLNHSGGPADIWMSRRSPAP
jgi:serine/threonine protein kinase